MKAGKDFIGVSSGGLILNDKGEVLLIKRTLASKFDAGLWTMIVGEVEYGETLEAAMQREAMEEAGIDIEVTCMITLVELLPTQNHVHWVGVDYLCRHTGGVLTNTQPDKHEKLQWFAFNKLPAGVSPSTQHTIDVYLKQK